MKKYFLNILISMLVFSMPIFSQLRNDDVYKLPEMSKKDIREYISIPGFDGYQALKCDFHIHTVFSDGLVWPDVRVDEAWQQGLDAIAITDHIEYRPFKQLVGGDLNESFNIAKARGNHLGFIVIKGTEVTREKPIGHLNALFIEDANKLQDKDPVEVLREAKKQGAFIMWNHPGWPEDKSTLYPIHEQLIKDKLIDGIEIFNYLEYYPITIDYANRFNLTFMGNSDIHELITTNYGTEKMARPITLVFANERSEKGIKEALFAGRSAALFYGILAGKDEILRKLFLASIDFKTVDGGDYVEITNKSDILYNITLNGKEHTLFPQKTIRVIWPSDGKGSLKVKNCHTGKDSRLEFVLPAFF